MKKYLVILILLFINTLVFSQSAIEFSQYLGENAQGLHHFGSRTAFPQNKISEDFGPRPGLGFHGGVDYNSRGTGDNDIKDLLHSLESGTGTIHQDDGVVQDNYSKWITIKGAHNVRYIHIFEKDPINIGDQYNFGGVSVKHINVTPQNMSIEDEEWAIIFMQNGVYTAIGPVEGTVTFEDELMEMRTISVSNTVEQGDPVAALGNSKNFVGAGHLHIELLSQLEDSNENAVLPADDRFAKNPLQLITHTTPNYCLQLLQQNDVDEGVQLTYPGTSRTTLQSRIRLLEGETATCVQTDGYSETTCSPTCVKRYNETMNIEFIDFQIKSDLSGNWEQFRGRFVSRIVLGGLFGVNVEPSALHTTGYAGSWGERNGIFTEAYNTHPWDDCYLNDFYTRLHKEHSEVTPNPEFTDTPINAFYNDGVYEARPRMFDVNLDEHIGDPHSFTLDNFQPFLTNFSLSTDLTPNALTFAEFNRSQDENGATLNNGLVVNQSNFAETNEFTESFTLSVLTSEPMESMQFRYSFESGPNTAWANMTVDANDPLKWNVEVEDNFGCYLFNFRGEDKSGNPLINVHDLTNENTISESVLIPTRLSNTSWVNNPSIVGEDFYSVCTTPACESQIEDNIGSGTLVSDCEDIDAFNVIAYVDCEGNYFVELDGLGDEYFVGWLNEEGAFKLGAASHPASIGQNCYVIENENGCCSFQGCIEVTGEERYADNFTYRLTDGPLGTKSIFISTGADGLNFPIMIKVIDANGNDFCSRLISSSEEEASCIGIEIGESYCVEYTDASGCVYESCFTTPGESCPDPIFVTADNITPECEKSYNGAINILIEGNSCERYVVKWDNEWEIGEFGQNEFQLTGLKTGNYCVTVADVNCNDCEISTCFAVPEIPQPCESGNCQEALANEVTIDTEFIFFNTLTNTCDGGSFIFDATGSSVFPVNITVNSTAGDGCLFNSFEIALTQFDPTGSFNVNCLSINSTICAGEYCFNIERPGCSATEFCRTIEYCEGKSRDAKEIACFTNGDGTQGGNNTGKENLEIAPPITGDNPLEIDVENTVSLVDNSTLTLTKVYPNPFTTDINIQLESIEEQTVQVELTDIYGRTVIREIQQLTKGVNIINLQPSNNLASGIYALTIIDQHQKKYTQLITRMNN